MIYICKQTGIKISVKFDPLTKTFESQSGGSVTVQVGTELVTECGQPCYPVDPSDPDLLILEVETIKGSFKLKN